MPTEVSAILALPYIQPAQAQKHVTHNEALRKLDLLVQLAVSSRQASTPPALPAAGERHIVPAGATGAFAGQDHRVALWDEGGWSFFDPQPGWQAEVLDEGRRVVFDGLVWAGGEGQVQRVAGLGVNTDSDSANRLAVAGEATLLTHVGAGHQVKVNKAGAGDTASLLFQTGWSGRAEMGTAGSDNFEIKTSADGSTFQIALRAMAASGRVEMPAGATLAAGSAAQPGLAFLGDGDTGLYSAGADQIGLSAGGAQRALLSSGGLTLNVPLTGTAVMQGATDLTAGRLVRTGDYGLGTAITLGPADNLDALTASGFYYNPTSGNTPGNNYPLASAGTLMNIRRSGSNWTQRYSSYPGNSSAAQVKVYERSYGGAGWSPWLEMFHQGTILGPVSQAGGVPTGAMLERGSNANGDYARFADGTQICTLRLSVSTAISTAFLGGFRSAAQTWTFPAAFATGLLPCLTILPESTSAFSGILTAAPTVAGASWAVTAVTTQTSATRSVALTATGRWF